MVRGLVEERDRDIERYNAQLLTMEADAERCGAELTEARAARVKADAAMRAEQARAATMTERATAAEEMGLR